MAAGDGFDLNWKGHAIQRGIHRAAGQAINATMRDGVQHAKANHPGWKNRTATAEGSVKILKHASQKGSRAVGMWGSSGVGYVIWLELKHGAFLRNAADTTYAGLMGYLRTFAGLGR